MPVREAAVRAAANDTRRMSHAKFRAITCLVAFFAVVLMSGAKAAVSLPARDQLVMFEQEGCPYCAAWNRDVGNVYSKSDEGKAFPLRRVDIHHTRPADLRAVGSVRFTPTFVVMHCGREFARITGYLGNEQFWGLLDQSVRSIKESSACAS
ncbi:hypothetical protein WPS_14470 [Vulcanimicrobium alpinum]|uniref:Thioredoxin-like fold domain-containing protein n=2 Tax=Vulcanimicrobium alpinum TaxID=3016050 RepID=A0AAN1XX27_UNVUL|nr:hypothetical protein WPS_14470 [Vulcanimicrobium alpinum]